MAARGRAWQAFVVLLVVTCLPIVDSAATAATAKSSSKPETSSLNTPLTASSAAVGYQYFAAQSGYYDRYGLSVSAAASDATQVKAAMVAGSVTLDNLGVLEVLSMVSAGIDAKIIGCQQYDVPFQVWAKNDVKNPRDLKGKQIGVSSLSGSQYVSTVLYLKRFGLTDADVTLVPLQSVPNVLAALQAGRIDATLLSFPFYQTASQTNGLHKIGDATLPPTIAVALGDWAKHNTNTILAWIKGNTEGWAAYFTHKDAALPVLAKFLKLSLDDPTQAQTVLDGYKLYLPPATPPIGTCTKALFDTFLPFLSASDRAQIKKPERLLDNSYVQTLVDDGFYTKIEKKYGALPDMPK